MILRIVLGRFASSRDAAALPELRERLTRAARLVNGLESLLVGARRRGDGSATPATQAGPTGSPGDDSTTIEAAIATVWRDVDSMARATAIDEESRFIASRLELPFQVDGTDHYEIVGRTFAALPPTALTLLRILRVHARPNEEARLIETLRAQQPRLVEFGLVASHLGRRVGPGGEVEAIHVSVWPSWGTIRQATGGRPELPFFAEELGAWQDRLDLQMYDGLEIAPRLPAVSGPPLFVIDEQLRIVDITASAAAMLGMPASEMVGKRVDELSLVDPARRADLWRSMMESGWATGETAWMVPDIGAVLLHYVARRDVPIPGRHAVLVRRRQDEAPTLDDLHAALKLAFPQLVPPD